MINEGGSAATRSFPPPLLGFAAGEPRDVPMAVRIESQAEPLPGYRLIERLGGGGFGEVWKCEAPGGLHKAIKFVYGEREAVDAVSGSRAEQGVKALNRRR